jgi:hypothetical protein
MSAANNPAEMIIAATKEARELHAAYRTARAKGAPERASLDIGQTLAYEKLRDLKAAVRSVFARSRGWSFNKRKWTMDYPVLDHCEFYDAPDQKQIALVTHSYATLDEIARYAARRGFIAEKLPFSWHNPGPSVPHGQIGPWPCTAVVFTLKPGATWR